MKPDGDLWRLVDSLVQQRSANATKVAWVKGHVSLQMLDQGYSVRNAVLNSYADAAADAAYKLDGLKLQHELLDFFGKKQREMVGILTAILRRIARVAKAANEMLALIVKEHAITEIDAPLFSHACFNSGVGLSFLNATPILLDDASYSFYYGAHLLA